MKKPRLTAKQRREVLRQEIEFLPWDQLVRACELGNPRPKARALAARQHRAKLLRGIVRAAPEIMAALQLSRRNVGSMLHMLPLKAPLYERKSLETWLGEINGALGKANVF
jgi:hypothetical protein